MLTQVVHFESAMVGTGIVSPNALKNYEGQLYCAGLYKNGSDQTYLSAQSTNGNILWEKTYPCPGRDESFQSIDVDSTGIYCVGSTKSTSQVTTDGLVMRLRHTGAVVWQMRIPGVPLQDVKCVGKGNIVVTGVNGTFKLDSTGDIFWSRRDSVTTNPYHNITYSKVLVGLDSCIYSVGQVLGNSGGYTRVVVTKSDQYGQRIWTKGYGPGTVTYFSSATTNGTEVFVAARCIWPGPNGIYYTSGLMKIDTLGSLTETSDLSSLSAYNPIACMRVTPFNTVICVGAKNYSGCLISEYDVNTLQSIRTRLNLLGSYPGAIEIDTIGNTWYSYGVVTPNAAGVTPATIGCMDNSWNAGCGFYDDSLSHLEFPVYQNNFSVVSTTGLAPIVSNANDSSIIQMWSQCVNMVSVEESDEPDLIIYPNPVSSVLTLLLGHPNEKSEMVIIMNSQGQLIDSYTILPGASTLEIPVNIMCTGIYFIRMADGTVLPFEVTED